MNIQIASDLHLEFTSHKDTLNILRPSAPILALLGDICCINSNADFAIFTRFINEILNKYEHIILIPGNHEYYFDTKNKTIACQAENTMDACDAKMRAFCRTSPKLHYLKNSTMKFAVGGKKYMIIGSTLWSYIPESHYKVIKNNLSEYSFVYTMDQKTEAPRLIEPRDICSMHMNNIKYIKKQLDVAKKTKHMAIVLTHHKPYYSNKVQGPLDYAYESDCSALFKPPLIAWAYGHTHQSDKRMMKGVAFISNPKGYPRQQTKFNNKFTVQF